MIVYLLLTFVLLLGFHFFLKNRNLPPGPWGLPIFGYLPWINPSAPYLTLTELSKQYGEIYGLQLGSVYTVVLTNPKHIKKLFLKECTTGRAPLYLTHGIMNGYGLICAEGDLWKDQRKFIYNCLKQLGISKISNQRTKIECLIEPHVKMFLESIENVGLGIAIDPFQDLQHSIGSVINGIVFGKYWSKQNETWKWLQHLQEEGTKHIGIAGPLNFLPLLRFIPKYKETMKFLINGKIQTHKLYENIIDEHRSEIEKKFENNETSNIIQAFLLERIKLNNDERSKFYNDQQFYHLLADIFGASLDTTFATLRWLLLFLAKHKDIQHAVRKELQNALENRSFSIDDMSYLPLLEATICETQRLRSVVPVGIPHGLTCHLTFEGYNIPKGTMLVPLQWAVHMNDTVWNEAEKFSPYRFLDAKGAIKKSEYFMPFQVGKRMCVGEEFARILLFYYGTSILQQFSISLEDTDNVDIIGECGITLSPKPYKLIFNKVDSSNFL